MCKRASIIISLLILTLFSSVATTQELKYYVSAHGGLAMPLDAETTFTGYPDTYNFDFDTSPVFGGAVGAANGPWRSEVELGYRSHDADAINGIPLAGTGFASDVDILTGLVNVYYDHDIGHALKPFVTAGIGFANIDARLAAAIVGATSDDTTVLAWQVGAGLNYALSDRFSLEAKYRFLMGSDPEFEIATSEFRSHDILFGVRLGF